MSLSMDALRWITVRALRGRTWALDNVVDSPSTPADIRVEEDRTPFIAVFVDEADTAAWRDMRDINNPTLTSPMGARLVIEVGVAGPHTFTEDQVEGDDSPPAVHQVTEINATDQALEFQIGIISHQVREALLSTSENAPWSEIWRSFVGGALYQIQIVRGGPPQSDAQRPKPRYASRITIIHVGLPGVPPRGSNLDDYPLWKAFLEATDGDGEMEELGKVVRAHIDRPQGVLPDWRQAMKLMTVTKQTVKALGIAPQEGFDVTVQTEQPVHPIHEVNLADEQMPPEPKTDWTNTDGDPGEPPELAERF